MKHLIKIKQALLMIHIRLVRGCCEQIVVLGSRDSLKLKTVLSHSHSAGQSEPGECRLLNTYENKYRPRTHTRWIKPIKYLLVANMNKERRRCLGLHGCWAYFEHLPFHTKNQTFSHNCLQTCTASSHQCLKGT